MFCLRGGRLCVFAREIRGATHPDEQVWEGSSGVFGDVDRWDDPVSLLPSQPVGGGAPLVFPGELDDFGLGVPDSGQHFCDASLEKKPKRKISHLQRHCPVTSGCRIPVSPISCCHDAAGWSHSCLFCVGTYRRIFRALQPPLSVIPSCPFPLK